MPKDKNAKTEIKRPAASDYPDPRPIREILRGPAPLPSEGFDENFNLAVEFQSLKDELTRLENLDDITEESRDTKLDLVDELIKGYEAAISGKVISPESPSPKSEPYKKVNLLKEVVMSFMDDYLRDKGELPNLYTTEKHLRSISFEAEGGSETILEVNSDGKITWKSATGAEKTLQRSSFKTKLSLWKKETFNKCK